MAKLGVSLVACAVLLTLTGCRRDPGLDITCEFSPNPAELAKISAAAHRYENDSGFRRKCLEQSLVNPLNGYSQVRLTHYDDNAWGSLPIAGFKTRAIVPADLGQPVPEPDAGWNELPFAEFTESPEGLQRRGELMFTHFPAQIERSVLPILKDVRGPSKYGFWQTPNSVGGLVWVALPGGVFPALTCSSCHASADRNGTLHLGIANYELDLGKAKDDYANRRSLFSTWGPGRIDIAADGRDNPIVIADVRAVRYERNLHRTANVRNSLIALALRVETGLIAAHYNAVRPKRIDAFALAYFLWSLGAPLGKKAALSHQARPVFERHCASCHAGIEHAGPPILADSVESPTAKMPSVARGTGTVQTVSLLGVSARKRLLYEGKVQTFDELLAPNRTEGGHYVGKTLTDSERLAIKDYLEHL